MRVVFTRHGDRTPITTLPRALEVPWTCYEDMWFTSSSDIPSEGNRKGIHRLRRMQSQASVGRLFRKTYIADLETLPGDCARGMLTALGASQHRALGITFRNQYVVKMGFLPAAFNSSLVYVRSTDIQRTLESAQNQVDAMFPPVSETSSKDESNVEVVNIETTEDDGPGEWMYGFSFLFFWTLVYIRAKEKKKTTKFLLHQSPLLFIPVLIDIL